MAVKSQVFIYNSGVPMTNFRSIAGADQPFWCRRSFSVELVDLYGSSGSRNTDTVSKDVGNVCITVASLVSVCWDTFYFIYSTNETLTNRCCCV